MTIYLPDIERRPGPKYRAIAEAIADDIAAGRLAPDSRLPPQRDMAWQLGVTVGTVGRAYAEVAERGLVHGEVGRGTFVSAPPAPTPDAGRAAGPGFIDLTRNAPTLGPQGPALQAALARLAAAPVDMALLDYQDTSGPAAHRHMCSDWLTRRGLSVPAEQIMVCGGAQHGLALALSALSRPGDAVLTEALCYAQFRDLVRVSGRDCVAVALDDDGMQPDALEAAAQRSGARICYVVPTLQNPTNAVMSAERRQAIVEVARRNHLLIIEDDVYGYLIEDAPPPLAVLAPERTIHVTSLSKALAPGLRFGCIAAPLAQMPPLVEAQRVTHVAQPMLMGTLAQIWFEDGSAKRLLNWQRSEARARHDMAVERLAAYRFRAHPASFHLLLETPPPWNGDSLAAAMRRAGVAVLPASLFATGPDEGENAVRLSLSQPHRRRDLATALDLLCEVLTRGPQHGQAII